MHVIKRSGRKEDVSFDKITARLRKLTYNLDTNYVNLIEVSNGQDVGKGAPMACAMVYWGRRYDRFFDVFIEHGAVVDVRSLQEVKIGAERKVLELEV